MSVHLTGHQTRRNPGCQGPTQVDALTLRFPDVDRAELERLVHDTYDRLKDEAAVGSHLVAMTEGQVTDELRRRGETVHVRSDD
ncbi:hypothetical protein M1L60_02610 [Actinoplanes sp. TRM 88003]|uniref:Uncharacterized protein n=1 Tax=Paractinoplanes aksuensis TaxID=2939490 RepID=A0ABT1DF92_9ACTN|nr:hypothetical protein [Actinoplanes aksuensis]MCO8269479.1 hypothetical protein [Actinoplanes aksuensis]